GAAPDHPSSIDASATAKPGGRTFGWVAVGVGAAALAGAGVSALVRVNAVSTIDDQCPSHQDCPPSLRDTQSRAKTFGALAIVFGVVGIASTTTGVVLLSRPAPASSGTALALSPWVGPGEGGATGTLRW